MMISWPSEQVNELYLAGAQKLNLFSLLDQDLVEASIFRSAAVNIPHAMGLRLAQYVSDECLPTVEYDVFTDDQ